VGNSKPGNQYFFAQFARNHRVNSLSLYAKISHINIQIKYFIYINLFTLKAGFSCCLLAMTSIA
ncbi:MAG: hypothetical protein LUQ29_12300, partial [Methylococcaceae bacterium]|nr:hypothetical protein [Methylococcaceae bacterium]